MIVLNVCKNTLKVMSSETITSGSVNAYRVRFHFTDDWAGLERVAVFRQGADLVSVLLDGKDECIIPWEVMRQGSAGKLLHAGVYGVAGGDVVLPTVWGLIGTIQAGTTLGPNAVPPTPSVADQFLADVSAEREKAEAAAERAESAAAGGGTGGTGNVSSPEIQSIRVMDRADYDALEKKSDQTLYLIWG